MTSLDEVIDYMAVMLPTEGIEPIDLHRIKQFLKKLLQQHVNEALLLFTSEDDQNRQAANQAREIALKSVKSC